MSNLSPKDFIKKAIKDVLMSPEYDENILRRYLSEKHTQHVHGRVYDFKEFLKHTKKLKHDVKTEKVEYIELMSEGNKVCAHYDVHSVKKSDNSPLVVRVMVIFYIEDGKIVRCHELSHLLVGDESDRDVAYRL